MGPIYFFFSKVGFFPLLNCAPSWHMAWSQAVDQEKGITSFPPDKQKNKNHFDSRMHLVKFH